MIRIVIASAFICATATGAIAQSWQAIPNQPFAYLPPATQGKAFGNSIIACANGSWTLTLHTQSVPTGPNGEFQAQARLVVDGVAFPTTAQPTGEGSDLPVPDAAVAALRAGNRLTVEFQSGRATFTASFSLRGSNVALDQAVRHCGGGVVAASPGGLTAQEVQSEIVGVSVIHQTESGEAGFTFMADGRYESVIDGRAMRGGYSIQPDGRLCWENTFNVAGCFRYYRDPGGTLHVKRDDPQNSTELGTVLIRR